MKRYVAITAEDEPRHHYIDDGPWRVGEAREQAFAALGTRDFDLYEITINAEPETDLSPEDCFDDPETVKAFNESPRTWAWCHVTVNATDPETGDEGRDTLGACSYEGVDDFAQFTGGSYFQDMVFEAVEDCRLNADKRRHEEEQERLKSMAQVTRYIGEDGALVVEIDTPYGDESIITDNEDGPTPLRVYLNDGIIYANPDL